MNGWIAAGSYFIIHRHGPLAQWLEQATHNRLVAGSSPAGATKFSHKNNRLNKVQLLVIFNPFNVPQKCRTVIVAISFPSFLF